MGVRVSRLSDTGVALCRSMSKVKKPNFSASGTTFFGPIPLTSRANVCSPGSPCISQYLCTCPEAVKNAVRPSSSAAEAIGTVLPSTKSTIKIS